MNIYIEQKQEEFNKAIEFFKNEIANLRTGRATASILDKVLVNIYGSNAPLNTLASITVQDAHNMIVAPWDKNILKDAEKGIVEANLGLGVVNEGEQIRISIPQMTEEKRKEIVKQLSQKYEAARIGIRQARDEVKHNIETAKKNKEISEDDKFRFLKDLEDFVHEKYEDLKNIKNKKEDDIMTI